MLERCGYAHGFCFLPAVYVWSFCLVLPQRALKDPVIG